MIKKLLFPVSGILFSTFIIAQNDLPKGFSVGELQDMQRMDFEPPAYSPVGITTPPTLPVRNMAQWEEIQALTITWRSYASVLREIVRAARQETTVIINCNTTNTTQYNDSTNIKNYLTAGGVPLSNIRFNAKPSDAVWIRDYGANPCYLNNVDSLILVDWKYNRPTRVNDDTIPRSIARMLQIPLYETIVNPYQLVHTGGNYMTDGMNTAFSSHLILDENSTKTEAQINSIMDDFMGIDRYIKMETLPYDGIHHIDMHMKLLDEETLLVGQYPNGIADGPQIEANIQYVLSNFNSSFGTPYKVIRIPQPPDQLNGFTYPNTTGNYLTYTNATIINKTVIVPQFYAQYDTTAIRIWKDAMPGYKIVGINSNSTISASGSLHCITHSVGVQAPLRIVHQNLPNTTNTVTPYQVDAIVQHKSGIQFATLYYTTDTANVPYTAVTMTLTNASTDTWTGFIPAQVAGTHVYYYIKGHANSGKEQVRPMPAPAGNFEFDVLGGSTEIQENETIFSQQAFPNPSHGITCIPTYLKETSKGSIKLYDVLGKLVSTIYEGEMPSGTKNYFINTSDMNAGAYFIVLETTTNRVSQKLMVK